MKLYMGMPLTFSAFVQIFAMAVFQESCIKGSTLQYSVGVAKLSVEQGFLVLRPYNWGWITIHYKPSNGVSAIQGFLMC